MGLSSGWAVEEVDLSLEKQRVQIKVAWKGGNTVECPECGGRCGLYDLRTERTWRHLDTMPFETIIGSAVPRCECPEHGVKTIATPGSGKGSRYTLMFQAFALAVSQSAQNVTAACDILKQSWHQCDDIRKRAVERGLKRRPGEPLERLGLDEKSFGKHHDYVSILTDLDRGRVLDVVAERKEEAAADLLKKLTEEQHAGVLAIAMDMWPAFMNAAKKHLPGALLVHDKFHVAKHLNESIDAVRKREKRALCEKGDNSLVGHKYTVLKRRENLTEAQRERFELLKRSAVKTMRAHSVKELFEEFWKFEFVEDAASFFKQWYNRSVRSRLEPVKRKARMLKKHLTGLLNDTIHPITNAVTEGLNSKIQTLKANARGFRSFESYRSMILFHCGKLDLTPA